VAPANDAALQRDLDLARGQGLELAPQGGTQLVSANELLPAGSRRTAPAAPRRVSHTPAPTPAPQSVAESQAAAPPSAPAAPKHDSVVAAAPAMPRPSAQGAVNPPPPGGYKTMGEIIRRAPFPINPEPARSEEPRISQFLHNRAVVGRGNASHHGTAGAVRRPFVYFLRRARAC
jgi:hypothetical protein